MDQDTDGKIAMKIALVRKRYIDHGGAERYVATLSKRLCDLGHEVHVYASEWKVDNRCKMQDARCKIKNKEDLKSKSCGKIIFHRVPIIKGLSFVEALSFAINSKRLLKKERFDVIHSCERTLYQDIYRAGEGCHREWLIQRAKVESPTKTLLVRLNPLHQVLLALEKRIFKGGHYKYIIANSRRGKEQIVKHYEVPERKLKIIYNGVNSERFQDLDRNLYRLRIRKEYGLEEKDKVLIFVGSGFKRKGLAYAIWAMATIKMPDVKLLVVGRDNPKRYINLSQRLNLNHRVIFAGSTPNIEKFYAASDVFILPSIYEPFSNACLEAMACELPVITTEINGASEVIKADENGYIIKESWDTDALSDAIKKSLDLDRQLIRETNDKILKSFSWERHVTEIVGLYLSICKKEGICLGNNNNLQPHSGGHRFNGHDVFRNGE